MKHAQRPIRATGQGLYEELKALRSETEECDVLFASLLFSFVSLFLSLLKYEPSNHTWMIVVVAVGCGFGISLGFQTAAGMALQSQLPSVGN